MFMVKKTGISKYMESIMKLYSLYIKNCWSKYYSYSVALKRHTYPTCWNLVFWKKYCMIEGRLNISLKGRLHFFRKKITACLEECSILCRGTVSWTKSYFVWKENCSLWMKLPFFKHGKECCNLKQIASFKKCCAFWPEYVLIFLKVIVYLLCFCKRFPTNTTSLTSTKS